MKTLLANPKLSQGCDFVKHPAVPESVTTCGRASGDPQEAVAAPTAFKVREWRPYSKNTLVGFVSLELPSGLILHNVMLHEKGESRWVSMPAREFQKDGERSWVPLIEFADRDCRESFQQLALEAIDAYLREGGE